MKLISTAASVRRPSTLDEPPHIPPPDKSDGLKSLKLLAGKPLRRVRRAARTCKNVADMKSHFFRIGSRFLISYFLFFLAGRADTGSSLP